MNVRQGHRRFDTLVTFGHMLQDLILKSKILQVSLRPAHFQQVPFAIRIDPEIEVLKTWKGQCCALQAIQLKGDISSLTARYYYLWIPGAHDNLLAHLFT